MASKKVNGDSKVTNGASAVRRSWWRVWMLAITGFLIASTLALPISLLIWSGGSIFMNWIVGSTAVQAGTWVTSNRLGFRFGIMLAREQWYDPALVERFGQYDNSPGKGVRFGGRFINAGPSWSDLGALPLRKMFGINDPPQLRIEAGDLLLVKSRAIADGRRYRFIRDAIELLIPWWLLAPYSAACGWILWRRSRRRRRSSSRYTCPTCGYDLRATPNRCPECGRKAQPMSEKRG